MKIPESLTQLVGHEHDLDKVSRALTHYVDRTRPGAVGAYQISCSDETEKEQVATFHRVVVRNLLPELKFWSRSAFRTANLGARYELGAAAIAESHYATATEDSKYQVLVIKLNAHVAVIDAEGTPSYGLMDRYNHKSTCCGALRAMLDGSELPFAKELRETFLSGGIDRIAGLLDEESIAPSERALVAAICSSHLQTERLIQDLYKQPPLTPTLYVITHAVTLNRTGPDTELLCGCVMVDTRTDPWEIGRAGFGDDPRGIKVEHDGRRLTLRRA